MDVASRSTCRTGFPSERAMSLGDRAAGERPVGEDQGGVGVLDVPARARLVVIGVGFAKVGIAIGDRAVLGSSTAGNPAADGKAEGESDVESGTIGAGLGAGDDLLDDHDQREVIVREGVEFSTEGLSNF
jgi:hypothetical protein